MPEPITPENKPAVITVPMGAWSEGRKNDFLETLNLGPCIGVAIYEPVSNRGFLGHFPNPQEVDGSYDMLENRLRDVFSDEPESFSRMQAWLSGGARLLAPHNSPNTEALVAENRKFVATALSDIGIPEESIQVIDVPEEYIGADMTLDCAEGICHISFLKQNET